MPRAVFATTYANGAPVLPPMEGDGLCLAHAEGDGYSVLTDCPDGTVLVLVTTDRTTLDALIADPAYLFVEELTDAQA